MKLYTLILILIWNIVYSNILANSKSWLDIILDVVKYLLFQKQVIVLIANLKEIKNY